MRSCDLSGWSWWSAWMLFSSNEVQLRSEPNNQLWSHLIVDTDFWADVHVLNGSAWKETEFISFFQRGHVSCLLSLCFCLFVRRITGRVWCKDSLSWIFTLIWHWNKKTGRNLESCSIHAQCWGNLGFWWKNRVSDCSCSPFISPYPLTSHRSNHTESRLGYT